MGGVPYILTFHLHYLFGMSIKIRLTFCRGLCIKSKENPSDLCQGRVLIWLFIFILQTVGRKILHARRKAWVIWGSILLRVPSLTFPQHLKYHLSIQVLWCENWLSSNRWLHVRLQWKVLTTSNRCGPYQTFLGVVVNDVEKTIIHQMIKQDTSSDLPSQVYWIGTTGLASMTLSILH